MPSLVGVGSSHEIQDSFAAGAAAAKQAVEKGKITRPLFALLFSTSRHDPHKLREGVRSVLGPACRLFGGYAVGVITHDHLSYDGHEVGIAVVQSDTARLNAFLESPLPGNELEIGRKLGRRMAAAELGADPSLLLFYDTVNYASGEPRLNLATPLLAGIGEHLKEWPHLAGMGMIGDMQLQPTFQWFEDGVHQQSAMAITLGDGVRMNTVIMHGCRPAGRYHTITKTEGPAVLEIDNLPALRVIHQMLGPDSGLSPSDYSFFITLGVNRGDKFGEFREEHYANRMCIGVDESRGALIMFEDDLKPGMQVQLMRRSVDFSYIGPRTRILLDRVTDRRPILAFYIDCAGRAAAYCGMDAEEAVEVQKAIPADLPLLGVYSGVEIAKVGGTPGHPQALDWTGVLCILTEPA